MLQNKHQQSVVGQSETEKTIKTGQREKVSRPCLKGGLRLRSCQLPPGMNHQPRDSQNNNVPEEFIHPTADLEKTPASKPNMRNKYRTLNVLPVNFGDSPKQGRKRFPLNGLCTRLPKPKTGQSIIAKIP